MEKKESKMNILVTNLRSVYSQSSAFMRVYPHVYIISIVSPESDDVFLPISEDFVLRLKFHDLDDKYPYESSIQLLTPDMANQVVSFVKKISAEDLLLVHCEAGISRSSAMAGAISKYVNDDDSLFFKYPYLPNRHVYKLVLRAFYPEMLDIFVPTVELSANDSDIDWDHD